MDRIIRAVSADGEIRVRAIDSRDMAEEARRIHNASNTAAAALGRTLAAVSMMGADLKTDSGSVTMQIKGGGPLGTIVAVADNEGYARGYLQNPSIELPPRADGKIAVGAGVGRDGYMSVVRDLGMREPYTGQVALVSGEIAEDVSVYFAESEQVPTVCALGVLMGDGRHVIQAGGFIIQLLPSADEKTIEKLESNIVKLPAFTAMRESGMSLEDIVAKALDGFDVEILEEKPVGYRCTCSRRKVERALVSLGRDLVELAESGEPNEITCQFCDNKYIFTPEELRKLAADSMGK